MTRISWVELIGLILLGDVPADQPRPAQAAPSAFEACVGPGGLKTIWLEGESGGRTFSKVPAKLVVQAENKTGTVTASITSEDRKLVGALTWLAETPQNAASRDPLYAVKLVGPELEIQLLPSERHQYLAPIWTSEASPLWISAKTGRLRIRCLDGKLSGVVTLDGAELLSSQAFSYRAEILPNNSKLASPDPKVPPEQCNCNSEATDQVSEMQLREQGDCLAREHKWLEATACFEASFELYEKTATSETSAHRKLTALISQKGLLDRLIYSRFRIATSEQFSDTNFQALLNWMIRKIEIDQEIRNFSPSPVPENEFRPGYGNALESWRPKLATDKERIEFLEKGQPFMEALLDYFLSLGKNAEGLEVSELARARALNDLLAERQNKPDPPEPYVFSELQEIANRTGLYLVEYFQTERFLAIWVIAPHRPLSFKRVEVSRATLGGLVTDLVDYMERPRDRENVDMQLRTLYKLLIEPVADALPSSTEIPVALIPDGPLARVPFSALRFGDGAQDYLVRRYSFMYTPSIATLASIPCPSEPRPQPSLLALINPAQLPEQLPGISEGTLVAQRLRLLGGISMIRIAQGPAATETFLKHEAENYSTIFLGAHAFAERHGTKPATAVLLGASDSDDGYLTPEEIERLDLDSDLVFLAACQSGRGTISADGVLGLARSFLLAGSRSLITTLWTVPTESTFETAVRFCELLQRNGVRRSAQVLREAQSAAADKDPAPWMWAGLVLYGSVKPIQCGGHP